MAVLRRKWFALKRDDPHKTDEAQEYVYLPSRDSVTVSGTQYLCVCVCACIHTHIWLYIFLKYSWAATYIIYNTYIYYELSTCYILYI